MQQQTSNAKTHGFVVSVKGRKILSLILQLEKVDDCCSKKIKNGVTGSRRAILLEDVVEVVADKCKIVSYREKEVLISASCNCSHKIDLKKIDG